MTDDQLTKLAQEVTDLADELRQPCPTCGGTGLVDDPEDIDNFECPCCEGAGYTDI